MSRINRQSPAYKISMWFLLLISLILLGWLNKRILTNPIFIPADDFSHYWGAGHLLLSRANPYSTDLIQAEKNLLTGRHENPENVAIMWTPPWSMPIVMLFGLLDYPFSRVLWLLTNVAIILVCASVIWRYYSGHPKSTWVAWVIAFTFTPTISVLEKGQITPILLIGILGFLVFVDRKQNDWIAGAFSALISIKPQLFFLFWLALALWIFTEKKWKVLLSFILTILGLMVIPLIFNPGILLKYFQEIFQKTPTIWATPTFGSYLRIIFGIDRTWLQFIPMGIGIVWFLFYYIKKHDKWNWSEQIPWLILISFLFSGFGWTYDQVLSLIAIIPAFILLRGKNWWPRNAILITTYVLINLFNLFLHRSLDEFWFGWLAPAFFIWCYVIQVTFKPEVLRENQLENKT